MSEFHGETPGELFLGVIGTWANCRERVSDRKWDNRKLPEGSRNKTVKFWLNFG
jgi:hypothetical protein